MSWLIPPLFQNNSVKKKASFQWQTYQLTWERIENRLYKPTQQPRPPLYFFTFIVTFNVLCETVKELGLRYNKLYYYNFLF